MASKAMRISIPAADKAALERMARGGESRAALRAKAVLALAAGESAAGAARKIGITEKTVRAARDRFLADGVDGLRVRSSGGECNAPHFDAGVPDALKRWREPGRTGPIPLARLKIETWVRDCAALGLLRPDARLPERAWFRERFGASAHVVQSAFDALAAQGFVRTVPRGATFLARTMPFAGRFLLVLEAKNGICFNLEKAAHETERIRPGISWKTVWRSHATPAAEIGALARDIAMQRYCGVFMRFAHSSTPTWAPGPAQLASIPDVPMAVDKIYRGTLVSPMVRELGLSHDETLDESFAAMARVGRRRILVVSFGLGDKEEDATRKAAARNGVEIPDGGYISFVTEETDPNVRRTLGLLLRVFRPGDTDAILVRRDDHLKPLAAALRDQWGETAARRIPVVVWSAGRLLPDEGLDVEWRGYDLVATLLSFIDWCEAIRAGEKYPPDPVAAR